MQLRGYGILLITLLCACSERGRPTEHFKEGLSRLLQEQSDATDPMDRDNYQKILVVDKKIFEFLRANIPKLSLSEDANGLGVTDRFWVATSPDHKLRIWTWNTYLGRNMRALVSVYQFVTTHGVATLQDIHEPHLEDPLDNSWYTSIDQVQTSTGTTAYLPHSMSDFPMNGEGQTIASWMIENDKLNRAAKFFKTPRELLAEISLSYDYDEDYDDKEGNPLHGILVDSAAGKLYIPLVQGKVLTSRNLIYEFDGQHFVYKGISK